ncbi:hypothetical protein JW935_06865 [candidate division KSB1 bacterium]|nr:hypothetical protein [candidate division KSB1 bacterium]
MPFYEIFHDETIDLIKTVKPSPAVWLDTECGTGYLTENALSVFTGTEFVPADPSSVVENHIKRFDQSYFSITVRQHLNLKLLLKTGFSIAELFWFSHMQAGFYAIK